MNFSEKVGKNVEEAISFALEDLKVTLDDVNVEIVEEPTKGFLGIGSKFARVKVTLMDENEKILAKKKVVKKVVEKEKADVNVEKVEKKSVNIPKIEVVEKVEKTEYTGKEKEIALDFLKQLFEKMGLEVTVTAEQPEDVIFVSVEGKDTGTVIGKRGQTLDSVQYLANLVANKEKSKYVRVIINAEKYREKREHTLENLAERLASKVIKSGRSVRLEPMNPYERKVIHSTLQDNSKVKTKSEGEEPYRRVVIDLDR